ncbi:hypothetical protein C8J56DRAFT_768775, partial [Mycena floridula]
LSTEQLTAILDKLHESSLTMADALTSLLEDESIKDHPAMSDFGPRVKEILKAMHGNKETRMELLELLEWAHKETMQIYGAQLEALVHKSTGFYFVAKKATVERIAGIDFDEIASKIQTLAPDLWNLVGLLLDAAPHLRTRGGKGKKSRKSTVEDDVDMDAIPIDDGDTAWETILTPRDLFNDPPEPGVPDADEDSTAKERIDEAAELRKALLIIKRIVCISIMMHSTNQRCNALQTLIGIFLHAANTPETVAELLAHIGVSISTTAINQVTANLSLESTRAIKALGATLLTAYAYDNVDIDLKHSVPTIENPLPTLIHLTSATLLPLNHGVTHADLDCSQQLWEKFKLNRKRDQSLPQNPSVGDDDFMKIHPEDLNDSSGLLRRDRFNAWVFLRDLIHHGPKEFRQFKANLGDPETVEQIPIVKSTQVHACMMDIPCSTPAENGSVIDNLMTEQAGVGEKEKCVDIGNLVAKRLALVFGDLGVGEWAQSLLASRSEEMTPWRRLQFLIYVLGLFHVKMACADGIWRTFIGKLSSRNEADVHSLINHVKILRPRETGKISTKPGFRRMHEVILHVGIVSRLDIWRVELKTNGIQSLDAYAALHLTFEQLQALSRTLAVKHVADGRFPELRCKPLAVRDQVRENMLLRQQSFLLYEEMSFAMNEGDIGRVETCFLPWIWIFQGTGKHKYATFMRK